MADGRKTTCCGGEERARHMSLCHGHGGGGQGGRARLGETGAMRKEEKVAGERWRDGRIQRRDRR
jgi:hypothetical protein